MYNNFTDPPKGHYPISINDIVVGLIIVFVLTIISLFSLWLVEKNSGVGTKPSKLDTVIFNNEHIKGNVLNYTETP